MKRYVRDWIPYVHGFLATTLIVIALASVAIQLQRQYHLEQAKVAATNIAQLQSEDFADLLERIDVALKAGALFFSRQHLHNHFNADELDEYLKSLESIVTEADGIRILDQNGVVMHGHNIPTTMRTNLSDRAFYLRARDDESANGTLIIDGPLFARIAQKWVVVLARRLNKPDGTFAGVIYANIASSQFESALSSLSLGPRGMVAIRTMDHALVSRVPVLHNAVGTKDVPNEMLRHISDNPDHGSYKGTSVLDGVERTYAYRKAASYPFYVIVGMAARDYLEEALPDILTILSLAGITILIAALANYRGWLRHRAALIDLRERLQLNETLKQTLGERDSLNKELSLKVREAMAANVAKSAFLANMSHEMRTPLHQIAGLASLIKREPLTAKQADRFGKMETSIQHMTSLVDSVLELTRIEAGHLDLTEDPCDLREIVDAVIERYRGEAAEKLVLLIVDDLPVSQGLFGDRHHIQQALTNYLSNAVRFTQTGSITVGADIVQEDESSILVRFSVEDTGLGIAPEDLPRLFRIFEQVDNSATRQFGGLGIGLAITRKIAEALGGEAGCDSRYGHGSNFWFSVRLKKRPAPKHA